MLARHMLLLSVLLDTEVPVRQRSELFLELHNNASIQATTAQYLGKLYLVLGSYHARLLCSQLCIHALHSLCKAVHLHMMQLHLMQLTT